MPLASPHEAFLRTHFAFPHRPRTTTKPAARSLFLRFVDAIAASNQRKAEREIARYIRRSGGRLSDDLDREIADRFGNRT
jgi:hypothetical protein